MKNTLIALSLLSIIGTSSSRPSEAGLLVAVGGDQSGAKLALTTLAGGALGTGIGITIGSILNASGSELAFFWDTIATGALTGAGLGILLDVDGNLPAQELVEQFSSAFPFIDNQEVLLNLANKTREKFALQMSEPSDRQNYLVQFSAEEITELTSSSDISSTNFQKMVEALR